MTRPNRKPDTDAQWARDVERRLRTQVVGSRVGQWTLFEQDGALMAVKPGRVPVVLSNATDTESDEVAQDMRGTFVTPEDIVNAVVDPEEVSELPPEPAAGPLETFASWLHTRREEHRNTRQALLQGIFGLAQDTPVADDPSQEDVQAAAEAVTDTADSAATNAATVQQLMASLLSGDGSVLIPQSSILIDPGTGTDSVTFDAVGTGDSSTGTLNNQSNSLSWAHTIAADANIVVVAVMWRVTVYRANDVRTMTLTKSGVAYQMQSLGRKYVDPTGGFANASKLVSMEFFVLPRPPTGSVTLNFSVTLPSSAVDISAANSVSYKGWGATTVIQAASGTSSPMAQTVASATNHKIVHAFGTQADDVLTGTGISSYNRTQRFNPGTLADTGHYLGSIGMALGDADGASTVSFTGVAAGLDDWLGMALDLVPVGSVVGSFCRVYRATTSATSPNVAAGDNMIPTGTFDATDRTSADISLLNGRTFKVTFTGSYALEFIGKRNTIVSDRYIAPLYYLNGTLKKRAPDFYYTNNAQSHFGWTFVIYLSAGDEVTPGFADNGAWNLTGSAGGADTYAELVLLNRSYQ